VAKKLRLSNKKIPATKRAQIEGNLAIVQTAVHQFCLMGLAAVLATPFRFLKLQLAINSRYKCLLNNII